MKRREFLGAVGTAALWPRAAWAQQRVRRVGVFFGGSVEGDPEAKQQAAMLQSGLQRLGWTDGRDIRFDYRLSGGNPALMATHVAELLAMAPDVVVVRGNRPTAMMKEATGAVPIVFAQVGDPVGGKLIDNLARPSGNVTGFTHFEPEMGGKWIETLKDVAPSISRVALVMHPETPANIAFLRVAESVAPKLGVTVSMAGVRDAPSVEQAFAAASAANSAIAVMPHDVTVAQNKLIVALADRYKLPAVYPYRLYVAQGGLVSYSFDMPDHWRSVVSYVDRILRGEKPANLPVQAPTKFELVVNAKAAKSLGLTVPPTVLSRADEVIE